MSIFWGESLASPSQEWQTLISGGGVTKWIHKQRQLWFSWQPWQVSRGSTTTAFGDEDIQHSFCELLLSPSHLHKWNLECPCQVKPGVLFRVRSTGWRGRAGQRLCRIPFHMLTMKHVCIWSHFPLFMFKNLVPISMTLICKHHHHSSNMTEITHSQVLKPWVRVALDLQWFSQLSKGGFRKPSSGHPPPINTFLAGLFEQQQDFLPVLERLFLLISPNVDLLQSAPHTSPWNLTTLGGRCYNQGHGRWGKQVQAICSRSHRC